VRRAGPFVIDAVLVAPRTSGGCASAWWPGWARIPRRWAARLVHGPLAAPFPMRAGVPLPLHGAQAVCLPPAGHSDPGRGSEKGVREIEEQLGAKLRQAPVRLVAPSSVEGYLVRNDPERLYEYERSLGADAARATGADFALMGAVVRYEAGSSAWWASAFPASVFFTLGLAGPAGRTIIWWYRFDEARVPFWRCREPTEVGPKLRSGEPLAASTYFLEGLRWMTRGALAQRGVERAVRSFVDFLRQPRIGRRLTRRHGRVPWRGCRRRQRRVEPRWRARRNGREAGFLWQRLRREPIGARFGAVAELEASPRRRGKERDFGCSGRRTFIWTS